MFWSIFANTAVLIVLIMLAGYGLERLVRGRRN